MLLAAVLALIPLTQDGWRPATTDYAWEFPRDHWAHPDFKTEWWYQTGHLKSTRDTTRQFGYQFTFFRVGILPDRPGVPSDWASNSVIMGHASVLDASTGEHVFTEVLYRTTPLLGGFNGPGDTLVAWSRGPGGSDRRWTLTWNGASFNVSMTNRWAGVGFDLQTHPSKPRVFQGPNGFSAKTPDGSSASMYYSFTRLDTRGTLTFGGEQYEVVGTSWMDKEFGSHPMNPRQTGWDWFSLQLDNGQDIMLYVLRSGEETDHAHATLVAADGVATYPAAGSWSVNTRATWTSAETSARYPSRWTVEMDNRTFDVRPVVEDQENVSALVAGLHYWEGAVVVTENGRPAGRGYVEMTGYGSSVLPALSGN